MGPKKNRSGGFGGYTSKILRVNLSDGRVSTEETNWEIASLFIGGRGYGAKVLFDELFSGVDPL